MDTIYLDNNATTPVDPDVIEAMVPFLGEGFGNASSVHSFGREAKVALENAREQIAAFIRCEPSELYFTSGGTESDNMAVLGTARRLKNRRNHIIVGATEHHAVIEPAEYLHEKEGFQLDLAPVDSEGYISPMRLRALVSDNTALVSIMHGNNETGTVQDDMPKMVEIAHQKGAIFHTDAVQSIGKVDIDVKALGVDLLSLTGHKIYGPKGCGALFIRSGLKIDPLLHGGSHEKRRRPGTENVAGAVGLAKALAIAEKKMAEDYGRLNDLADHFIDSVLNTIPDVRFNGTRSNRIPQTMNFAFNGVEGESVVLSLDVEGVAVSSGSACTSGAIEASHVLTAMGIDPIVAHGSVRFSMGRTTTREELDYVLEKLPPIIERLRAMSPVYNKQAHS
ncbi:aminotransferase class V-fold PLP-dependent enzyme [bacterium]|nr:aminotransferase class V-fold PLP-dependent enzyme [bacterium]